MSNPVNYPDILGVITKNARANFGVAQVALAVRPSTPRAGQPFEVLLLIQNASDVDVEVTATITLPESDARKQKGRFSTKAGRVVASVKPAEVGVVTIPVSVAGDAASAPGYHIVIDLDTHTASKPQRLRADTGGGAVEGQYVSPALKERIMALRALTFSANKRAGRSALELTFDLAPGKLGGAPPEAHSTWTSICKVSDYLDDRYLLHRYGALLQIKTLPHFKRAELYQPLKQAVMARFGDAGYPLKHAEAGLIAKLLTLILEYATPRFTAHGHVAAGRYNIDTLIARDPFTLENKPFIPFWMRGLIGYSEKDGRVAEHPIPLLTKHVFDDVLRDGIDYGFDLVERDCGEDVGTPEERANYREKLLTRLKSKSGIDFSVAYLPLVMGGMSVTDLVMLPEESPTELLKAVSHALESRANEVEEDDPIFAMTQDLLWRTGQKYGIKLS